MGCCDSKESNAATGNKSGTAVAPMGAGVSTARGNRAQHTPAKQRPGAPGTQQEQNRQRARDKAVLALIETFKANEALVPSMSWRRQYIKVTGIGPGVAAAIADKLTGKLPPARHNILTLDLRALKIGDQGFMTLCKALAHEGVVENVILSGNEITDAGAEALASALSEASSNIAGNKEGAGRPRNSQGASSQLRLLVLAGNPISSAGIIALASCLDRLPLLERLEIGRGQISEENESEDDHVTDEAAHALVRLIGASPSLQTLVYKGTGNAWRPDFSAATLTNFLTKVVGESKLSSLFLQECYTTKPVPVNTITTVVDHRRKPPRGASPSPPPSGGDAKTFLEPIHALSTALTTRSTQLTTLVLRFPLTDGAMTILREGIAHALLLANLSLRGCDLSACGLRLLADALRSNRTITALDISYQSNLIAHPMVLQELRNSSKKAQSHAIGGDLRESQGSSGTESVPSREEREHPLLPIIQVLHTNRTIAQLIMLGVNIQVDDIEELCSCVEQSNNHVLTDVAYTGIGADALNMKLENFLSANREYGGNVGYSVVSHPSFAREGSTGTLFQDATPSDPSAVSDYSYRPSASTGRNAGMYFTNASHLGRSNGGAGATPNAPQVPQHPPRGGNPPTATPSDLAAPSLPPVLPLQHPASNQAAQEPQHVEPAGNRLAEAYGDDVATPDDVELGLKSAVGADSGKGFSQEGESELGTAPYISMTKAGKGALK